MSDMKQELVMETTHGRKSKCKTEFKAVMNKVLVSGLILTTILSSTIVPAMAAESIPYSTDNSIKITRQFGVTFEQSVANVRNTIKAINDMKAKGVVSDSALQRLASQIYSLEQALSYNSDGDANVVAEVLNEAEIAVSDVSNAGVVKDAIVVVRALLGVQGKSSSVIEETHTVSQYKAQNIGNLKGFSDLGGHQWAIEAINDMSVGTYKGLFSGVSLPDENGLARFAPQNQMTRAEFITVVTRALYSDQLANMPSTEGGLWYVNNYEVALNNGLITESEYHLVDSVLNAPIPRQEMALILTRACDQMGEGTGTLVSTTRIADYNTVGSHYKDAVRIAFTKGLIAGKDNRGTFDPHATLTRAEGATVLYRLVNKSKRVKVTVNTGGGTTTPQNAAITIYEGQARYNRNAQEGDIFVKKDGTQIVLKKGPNGILGEGQGVAPDVGLLGLVTEKGCDGFGYKVADYGNWYDSTGEHLQGHNYWVNKTTGEGHWTKELHALAKKYPVPDRDGAYEGEVSSDPYSLWVWEYGDWSYNSTKR